LTRGSWPLCSPSTGKVEVPYSARFHLHQPGRHPDGIRSVGGLQMDQDFNHLPVMAAEVIALFGTVPRGWAIDATVGGAGHSLRLLQAHSHLSVLGLDRDPSAVAAARERLASHGARAQVLAARFDSLAEAALTVDGPVVGVLFDLGVSSPQLDVADRGFSYRHDGPLDMRMDPGSDLTAYDVVNGYSPANLARLFRDNGETRWAGRMADAIVRGRPVRGTQQLAELVASAVPAAVRRRGNPASRAFQAIRIEVNAELEVLERALDQLPGLLAPGGRVVVLAYHSGEDRIVKGRFLSWSGGTCTCPPGLPCACDAPRLGRIMNKGARKPSAAEVETNPRAASARLRAFEMSGGTTE
jgi:16S rRNA (cytosine1402-N4)-methyltransferase